ncbi:MAG: hypothetical protein M1816_007370 [Peltula sp. TS41687]|nr:MAG: hypothetical protein M1816_007370 [Peltula sp. TS41687]
MFYSHEILTSRKYGVATVWLVATLGSRSNLKKVNRKAILDVNVPKACETIVAPEAPMALRLQGNLLYGVSRVFSQQCGYVLADAQQAQLNLRALHRLISTSEIDPNAGRARPDQLMLPDDPAFLPDLPLIDFETRYLDFAVLSIPRMIHGPQAVARERQQSAARDPVGLVIPTSDIYGASENGGFDLPGYGLGPTHGAADDYPGRIQDEEGEGFLPDVGFEFDGEGNLRNIDVGERVEATIDPARIRIERESAASGRLSDQPFREDDILMGDEYNLPEAEPSPELAAAVPVDDGAVADPSVHSQEEQAPPHTVEQALPQRQRTRRVLEPDTTLELRHTELSLWSQQYVSNMTAMATSRQNRQLPALARQNAAFWVFGAGIGNIGMGVGGSNLPGPLAMFAGQDLMLALTSVTPPIVGQKRKSPSDEAGSPESEGRRVRARARDDDQEQVGRGDDVIPTDDTAPMASIEAQDFEVGREAPADLQDIPSDMPWNVSASVRGSSLARSRGFPSAGPSASGPGRFDPYLPLRRVSRMTSASPLVGRGRTTGFERLSSLDIAEAELEQALLGAPISDDHEALQEFELRGPPPATTTEGAAAVAVDEEQDRDAALEHESLNFLEYMRSGLAAAGSSDVPAETASRAFVIFEELMRPAETSHVVAAQAFYHTLALATRNLVRVEQTVSFGEIKMTPID